MSALTMYPRSDITMAKGGNRAKFALSEQVNEFCNKNKRGTILIIELQTSVGRSGSLIFTNGEPFMDH